VAVFEVEVGRAASRAVVVSQDDHGAADFNKSCELYFIFPIFRIFCKLQCPKV